MGAVKYDDCKIAARLAIQRSEDMPVKGGAFTSYGKKAPHAEGAGDN
ncbi:MAG: hypothetical protein LBL45_05635 [Treponema sp.]|jgi:hypothetical protein|nr:hypothetical protein [Treponema sp.]